MILAVALNPSTAIIHPPGSFCAKRVFAQNVRNFVTSRIYYDNVDKKAVMVNCRQWRRRTALGSRQQQLPCYVCVPICIMYVLKSYIPSCIKRMLLLWHTYTIGGLGMCMLNSLFWPKNIHLKAKIWKNFNFVIGLNMKTWKNQHQK